MRTLAQFNPDRRVHAENDAYEIVRYDKAGKWYMEPKDGSKRTPVTIREAVGYTLSGACRIHYDRQGGSQFDRLCKRLTAEGASYDRKGDGA